MRPITKITTPSGRSKYYFCGLKIASFRSLHVSFKPTRAPRNGKTVLIIRRYGINSGLFAHFISNLGWIRWALEHDMVPYIDLQTPDNFLNRGVWLPDNPWERFFKQCRSFNCNDALMSSHVKIVPRRHPAIGPKIEPACSCENSPELLEWRQIVHDQIRINDNIAAEVDRIWAKDFAGDKKILGCLVRGTDYLKLKPKYHAIQPPPEQVVKDALKVCDEKGFSHVFLATEDSIIDGMFRDAFGDRLLRYQTCMPEYRGGFLVKSGSEGDQRHAFEMTRQYMVSILLLARCHGLLAGCTSGSVGAMLLSNGYEWSKMYDLGFYD